VKYYYPDVPGIGNVAVSRHAQAKMDEEHITPEDFETVLLRGRTIPEGPSIVWRELNGIRIVILLKPEPFHGATLAKTVFRIQSQARSK
jgi:hypothetical protein